MPSFPDSIFLFVLALLLFGPKRLPVLARELGKWVGEFRRASNEFKMQMEDELRLSEQAERNKQIAAMEAAAPVAPSIDATEPPSTTEVATTETAQPQPAVPTTEDSTDAPPEPYDVPEIIYAEPPAPEPEHIAEAYSKPPYEVIDGVRTPLPIATSGDLKIMPPTTGLPTARTSSPRNSALNDLLDAIPKAPETPTEATPTEADPEHETTAHGN